MQRVHEFTIKWQVSLLSEVRNGLLNLVRWIRILTLSNCLRVLLISAINCLSSAVFVIILTAVDGGCIKGTCIAGLRISMGENKSIMASENAW